MIDGNTKITIGLLVSLSGGIGSVVYAVANMATRDFVNEKVDAVMIQTREDRKSLEEDVRHIRNRIDELYKLERKR